MSLAAAFAFEGTHEAQPDIACVRALHPERMCLAPRARREPVRYCGGGRRRHALPEPSDLRCHAVELGLPGMEGHERRRLNAWVNTAPPRPPGHCATSTCCSAWRCSQR